MDTEWHDGPPESPRHWDGSVGCGDERAGKSLSVRAHPESHGPTAWRVAGAAPPDRFFHMKLADRLAQFRTPFVAQCRATGRRWRLNNAAECASELAAVPIRFVMSDDLTRLCTALAYSKGARSLACADLVRIPAAAVWIEWGCAAWQCELAHYGIAIDDAARGPGSRRGVLLRASSDGRRGSLRTFWSAGVEGDVLASSVEAYFDLDTPRGEDPRPPPGRSASTARVSDPEPRGDDILSRCFRFHYERSWAAYYGDACLERGQSEALWRHALGTIALDIPVLLAFFLLLGTRSGLPQSAQSFERLNRSRLRAGKAPLLAHIDVRAPILPDLRSGPASQGDYGRRRPRLHHVRGHLVRRGSQLFWRVPHLRGSARQGVVRSRTVEWTFESAARPTASAPSAGRACRPCARSPRPP